MILYYDCFSGISGDMHLSVMIDAGVPEAYLLEELSKLKVDGYSISVNQGLKNSISGTKVKVKLSEGKHDHLHRNLEDIKKIIDHSELGASIKSNSIGMFTLLAEAEANVHGKDISEVHFHEVGAIDSIVDVVGAAICIDYLKPDKILSSPIELGGGFATCAHGNFPVPAPATAELLKNIPVKTGHQPFEATTPTGAAILAYNVDEFTEVLGLTIHKTAYGIGHKDSDTPNVLRVFLGEETSPLEITAKHRMIECNVDDMNPEILEYIMQELFEAGADDVFITPIIMKKSRNASKLCVLCKDELYAALSSILIRETSSFGFRSYPVQKKELERDIRELDTRYGVIRVKSGYLDGKVIKQKPEYEDCVKAARLNSIPLRVVFEEVARLING